MLPRRYRLQRRPDVQRVRRHGRRKRHPLAVMLASPAEKKMNSMDEVADLDHRSDSRFAFSASRRVGNAVLRNRAKRLLRAAVHARLTDIQPGWDCLLIAREGTPHASYAEVGMAVSQLLSRAGILAHNPPYNGNQGV